MTRTIEDVARSGGMTAKTRGKWRKWTPCPWGAGCEGDPAVTIVDGWAKCWRCGQTAHGRRLAELLGVDPPDDDNRPQRDARPTQEYQPGAIAIADHWRNVREAGGPWAPVLRQWLAAGGMPAELVEVAHHCRDVIGPCKPAGPLLRFAAEGYGLWFALRDPGGQVVDLERRWTGEGDPPGSKGMMLPGWATGSIPVRVIGSVEIAARRAFEGEPVFVVEGTRDYVAAWAMCHVMGRGAVVGSPGDGGLYAVAKALAAALRAEENERGRGGVPLPLPEVWTVPHLADREKHGPGRQGEIAMRRAAVALLDVADVRWCPPIEARRARDAALVIEKRGTRWVSTVNRRVRLPKQDLSDFLAAAGDWRQVWERLSDGARVLDPGEHDWTTENDGKIRRALRRLPAGTAVEALHWYDKPKEGWTRRTKVVPEHRLTDIVIEWMETHGARFFADETGEPWVMYRRQLLPLESDELAGLLYDDARIIKDTAAGKAVHGSFRHWAFRNPHRARLHSWISAGSDVLRVHLHDERERVLVYRSGEGYELQQNGDPLLITDPEVPPIVASEMPELRAWARELYDLIGRWLLCSPLDRSIVVAWWILTFIRDRLPFKTILWHTGPAGSGKSMGAKMLTTATYGRQRLLTKSSTEISLFAQSRSPLLVLENPEKDIQRFENFLLTAVTGGRRTKGTKTGGWANQELQSMIEVTSIRAPALQELGERIYLIEHAPRADGGFSEFDVLADIARRRSSLILGAVRFIGERIDPLWKAGEWKALGSTVPVGHPLWRGRETLAGLAHIIDGLGALDSRWYHGSHLSALFGEIQETHGARTGDMLAAADPVSMALRELLFAWNRITRDGFGHHHQPSLESEQFKCSPLFRKAHGGGITTDYNPEAVDVMTRMAFGKPWAHVVGFEGTYSDLHADVFAAVKGPVATQLLQQLDQPDVIRRRFAQATGWARGEAPGHARPRRYRWFLDNEGDPS